MRQIADVAERFFEVFAGLEDGSEYVCPTVLLGIHLEGPTWQSAPWMQCFLP